MQRFFLLFVASFMLFFVIRVEHVLAAGWAELDSPTNDTMFGISASGDTLYAVGEGGTVVYSDDAGLSWSEGDSNTSDDLYDVAALSTTKAVAAGEGGTLIRTVNGGEDWEDADVDFAGSSNRSIRDLNMVSSSVGFAVGDDGMVLTTTDEGASWSEIDGPSTSQALNNVSATSSSTLWVAGEGGVIYKSSDGGDSWSKETSGTTTNIISIVFVDSSHGFATGDQRLFLKTTNGGSTWSEVTVSELDSDETIDDVSFLNSSDGMLVSNEGTLLTTDDGGSSWDEVDSSGSPVLIDLISSSSSKRWGVGDNGAIYRYDSGQPSAPENFDVHGDNDNVTDSTPSFTWEAASDEESGIDDYEFKMDAGSYTNIGKVTSKTYSSKLKNGEHTAYLYAVDLGGNESEVVSVDFTVDADSSSGSAPEVSSLTPTTAVTGETVTLSTRLEDDGSIEDCDLYLDDESVKAMTVKTDLAYTTYKFSSSGTHTLYARCTDDDGNKTSGNEVSLKVSASSTYASPGDLIKIGCTGDVYVNDPCTAVYYYGVDGKRHPFPNEAVFFSWFSDFDDLVILTSSAMAQLSVGRNVTFKPGDQLIKFSASAVYALSYDGIIRPIANAAIAEALFDDDWVSKISVVSDVFYSNYRQGSLIESSSGYSLSDVERVTTSIDVTY